MNLLETIGFTWLTIGVLTMISSAIFQEWLGLMVGLPEASFGVSMIYMGDDSRKV